MLNREEYNETFNCNLTKEEFEKVMSKPITKEDILNGRVDRLTFCDKQGHKQEFAKVVKGEWIMKDPGECFFPFVCTTCRNHSEYRYKFCPHCGADMRGEKDEIQGKK